MAKDPRSSDEDDNIEPTKKVSSKEASPNLAKKAVTTAAKMATSKVTATATKSVKKEIGKQGSKMVVKGASKMGIKIAQNSLKDVPIAGIGVTAVSAASDLTRVASASHAATHHDKDAQKQAIESFVNLFGAGIGATIGGIAAGIAGAGIGGATGAVEGAAIGAVGGAVVTAPVAGVGGIAGGGGGAVIGAAAQGTAGAVLGVVVGAGEGAALGQTVASVISPVIARIAQPLTAPVFNVAGKGLDKLKEKTGLNPIESTANIAHFVQPLANMVNDPLSSLSEFKNLKNNFKQLSVGVTKMGKEKGLAIEEPKIEKALEQHFINDKPEEGKKINQFLNKNDANQFLGPALDNMTLGTKTTPSNTSEQKQNSGQNKEVNLEALMEKQPSFIKNATKSSAPTHSEVSKDKKAVADDPIDHKVKPKPR